MSKQFRRYLLVFIFAVWVLPLPIVGASPNIMPVEDIRTGMHGTAKTVVSGMKIEEFDVEVLGIMKNKGPAGDLILVRVSGDVINRTGGIAQGMSGSPVYIDDKIIGAISYGWKLADHRVGMVTPIKDMLKLWNLPDTLNETANKESDQITITEQPVATPLMASGFSERALERLGQKLQPYNLIPYAAGDAPEDTQFAPLEPGSPIGVQLVRGDVSLGALGTVTYVDQDKVLAFGHPFLKKGNVNFLMTNAYIFTTVDGIESPFKVGTVGNLVGVLNQDRGAGIAGKLNQYPGILPISIKVRDSNMNITREGFVQVVQDEQLAPIMAEGTVFNFLDKVMDRVGPGTAKISFEISGRGLPEDGFIKRENMYYSSENIAQAVTEEFFEAMRLITTNQYKKIDIMDVKVDVEVSDSRQTAVIVEANANEAAVKPGDTVNITVKLKAYRGDVVTRNVSYVVPKQQQVGPLALQVRGGGMIPIIQMLLKQQGLLEGVKQEDKNNTSLEEAIKEFTERDKKNELIVEVLGSGDFGEEGIQMPKIKLPKQNKKELLTSLQHDKTVVKESKNKVNTKNSTVIDYIVEGETQILLNVIK